MHTLFIRTAVLVVNKSPLLSRMEAPKIAHSLTKFIVRVKRV